MLALAADHWQYRGMVAPMSRYHFALAAVFSAGLASAALSQCVPGGPPMPAAVPHTITGIVLDRANHPIENASVFITEPRRSTKTRPDGRFELANLDTGVHEL